MLKTQLLSLFLFRKMAKQVFVYRDSFVGKALKKDVYLDGRCLGETADRVFFYQQISTNQPHTLGTESEFSPNNLTLMSRLGKTTLFASTSKWAYLLVALDLSRFRKRRYPRRL
jgi:hypothetical protein